jgi:hypothetical protein
MWGKGRHLRDEVERKNNELNVMQVELKKEPRGKVQACFHLRTFPVASPGTLFQFNRTHFLTFVSHQLICHFLFKNFYLLAYNSCT